jgi:molybdate transport system substrate-binding protein
LRRGFVAAALGWLLVAAGCTQAGSPPSLAVDAAASLGPTTSAISTSYASSHPGATLVFSTGSSAALRTQIEQGAPADVFLSADQTNAQALADEGLTDGTPVIFATNSLTVIVPADNPAGISSPADLARPGVTIIAAGDAVPITRYAGQAVAAMTALPGYPPDFADRYAANVTSREDNVAAVLAKIELGEGDAAIVYATDARSSTKVMAIQIPPTANVVATYAGVVVRTSFGVAAGHAFLDWLAGSSGQSVLSGFGFGPPS